MDGFEAFLVQLHNSLWVRPLHPLESFLSMGVEMGACPPSLRTVLSMGVMTGSFQPLRNFSYLYDRYEYEKQFMNKVD